MKTIPCEQDVKLKKKIEDFAEVLKTQAHKLGDHGLGETEFYESGLFQGAIERVRGQNAATMREKREYVKHILNQMQDNGYIQDWETAGESNRHDYSVTMKSGKIAVIELKGCLDGNNTIIFERPPHAEEFVVWSICTNRGSDPRHSVWSGIHTRMSAEIISKSQRVDGLIVWDYICASAGRPCPKIASDPSRLQEVGPYKLPPPCIYVFPATIPAPRNNPHPKAQALAAVELLSAFNECFGGSDEEVSYVDFEVQNKGPEVLRTTKITRNGELIQTSKPTAIRRT